MKEWLFKNWDRLLLTVLIVLQALLLILKINNIIDWNWGWVFSPIWGTLFTLILLIAVIATVFHAAYTKAADEHWGGNDR